MSLSIFATASGCLDSKLGLAAKAGRVIEKPGIFSSLPWSHVPELGHERARYRDMKKVKGRKRKREGEWWK